MSLLAQFCHKIHSKTINEIIIRDDIQLIKLIIKNGYKIKETNVIVAIENEKNNIINYFYDSGLVSDYHKQYIQLYYMKIKNKRIKYIKFNEELFIFAAYINDLDSIKILNNIGIKKSTWIFAYAVERGDPKTLIWLKENNFPYDNWIWYKARKSKNIYVLDWLEKNNFIKIHNNKLQKALLIINPTND